MDHPILSIHEFADSLPPKLRLLGAGPDRPCESPVIDGLGRDFARGNSCVMLSQARSATEPPIQQHPVYGCASRMVDFAWG